MDQYTTVIKNSLSSRNKTKDILSINKNNWIEVHLCRTKHGCDLRFPYPLYSQNITTKFYKLSVLNWVPLLDQFWQCVNHHHHMAWRQSFVVRATCLRRLAHSIMVYAIALGMSCNMHKSVAHNLTEGDCRWISVRCKDVRLYNTCTKNTSEACMSCAHTPMKMTSYEHTISIPSQQVLCHWCKDVLHSTDYIIFLKKSLCDYKSTRSVSDLWRKRFLFSL